VRYDVSQSSTVELIPKEVDKRRSKIWRSTVSKAADKSRRDSNARLLVSMAGKMSDNTCASAVSVE
jgi:hypothetical protein